MEFRLVLFRLAVPAEQAAEKNAVFFSSNPQTFGYPFKSIFFFYFVNKILFFFFFFFIVIRFFFPLFFLNIFSSQIYLLFFPFLYKGTRSSSPLIVSNPVTSQG